MQYISYLLQGTGLTGWITEIYEAASNLKAQYLILQLIEVFFKMVHHSE